MPISADDIALTYRFMLGRQPGPQETEMWRGLASVDDLRKQVFQSAEFGAVLKRHGHEALKAAPPARLSFNIPPPQIEWEADGPSQARLLDHVIPIPVAQYRLAQSRIPIEMMCHG